MSTQEKKSPKTKRLAWSLGKIPALFVILIIGLRYPGALINIDLSTVILQTSYNVQSKLDTAATKMIKTDPAAIKQQLELWEQAAAAQRRYAKAKNVASAEQLEKLRQEAELLTAAASSYHFESMTGSKAPRH